MPTAALESASGAAVLAPPAFKASVNSPHSVGNISWVGRHRQSSFRPLGERLTLPSSVNLSHAGLPKGHDARRVRSRWHLCCVEKTEIQQTWVSRAQTQHKRADNIMLD